MLDDLELRALTGLTDDAVRERLASDGHNELPTTKRRSSLRIAADVAREPMFLLLVACGVIYLALGDVEEALMLLGFVGVVMGITLYQEQKTERALEALRDLSSPRAAVIRNGTEQRVPGRDVVRDDLLIVREGDRVAADAVLLTSVNLAADESLLTGEAVPVRKAAVEAPAEVARPGGDDLPFVFASTLIVQGHGIARVVRIGSNTEVGRIGKALQSIEPEDTLLQKQTAGLVRTLAVVGVSLCALVVVVFGVTRQDWLNGLLAGITLAMATLPEEFPVVLTIFLALGAWRISRHHVLTRRVPAIETLGAATVLCVDKTGTLTLNRMAVSRLFANGQSLDLSSERRQPLPEAFHELVEFSMLASQIDPFDPMEQAIRKLGDAHLADTEHLHHDWTLVHEYPLSPKLLALSRVWKSRESEDFVIAAKGAPEAIADLCHFDEAQLDDLGVRILEMAASGLRVLGAARARLGETALPGEQHDFEFEFLGLIGLADPIRPAVPRAVAECATAGIRVVMITGDYPGTAMHIAAQIGLSPSDRVLTGPEIDRLDDDGLRARVRSVNIFARVVPEQKLRLVDALKAAGEIVAMTGDGVNDAPALKSAHIGIAMGGRGTDVARESAALVLLDDDFSSIVAAVKLGRRIFDNIKKAIAYILAIHVPIAGMSLIPVLLKWPLVLMPVHILFLELIIDPACSTIFEAEPEEADVMRRPPRSPRESLFGRRLVTLSLIQGVSVLLVVVGVFMVALLRGLGDQEARALSYTTMIIANLALILTNRSWTRPILLTLRTPNRALWWVLGGATLFLTLVLRVPFLRRVFGFAVLHPRDLALCLAAGFISVLWFEGLKLLQRQPDAVRR